MRRDRCDCQLLQGYSHVAVIAMYDDGDDPARPVL